MKSSVLKEKFEIYLKEKTHFYLQDKSSLTEAIEYSLLADGKRVRPLLVTGFAQGFGAQLNVALACGVAVEMIHTYSLIHDDLPAMDNDDYRRGRLSNHKVYGEATAILAGDSLLNLAPEFLLRELQEQKVEPRRITQIVTSLLKASGHAGMIKGQALDMEYEKKDLTSLDSVKLVEILRSIHKLKTGSLITWSCLAGLYSHTDEDIVTKYKCLVESIGQRIGLLFQIVDDILDETSSRDQLGKTPGKDKEAGKLTYISLYGLKEATQMALQLVADIRLDLEGPDLSKGDWTVVKHILETLEKKVS